MTTPPAQAGGPPEVFLWPISILIAVVWVVYAVVFFGTIVKRKVKHIYVANWFFGA